MVTIWSLAIITACIRRMREGNIFSLSTLAGGGGGRGTPSQIWGDTPSQVWMVGRGVPHPRSGWWGGGFPIPSPGWGGGVYPIPGLDGGRVPRVTPPPARSGWWGVPHPRSGWWGVPPLPGLDGGGGYVGYPPPGQVWMVGCTPSQVWMVGVHRVPPTPHPPIRETSIASTCYAAGGVPLAFTQEDFLVSLIYNQLFL